MTILDRLKKQVINDEFDALYDIWEGCYTDDEYDFQARRNLVKRFPETSWANPDHENMLVDMAIDSHVPEWDDKFLEGGWTKEGISSNRLIDLNIYYNIWLDINKKH